MIKNKKIKEKKGKRKWFGDGGGPPRPTPQRKEAPQRGPPRVFHSSRGRACKRARAQVLYPTFRLAVRKTHGRSNPRRSQRSLRNLLSSAGNIRLARRVNRPRQAQLRLAGEQRQFAVKVRAREQADESPRMKPASHKTFSTAATAPFRRRGRTIRFAGCRWGLCLAFKTAMTSSSTGRPRGIKQSARKGDFFHPPYLPLFKGGELFFAQGVVRLAAWVRAARMTPAPSSRSVAIAAGAGQRGADEQRRLTIDDLTI